jgi:hypothetical protein
MMLGISGKSVAQTFNFTTMMPPEFKFCEKTIGMDSPEYKSLYDWFNNNTTGWYESRRNYEPELIFESATMLINMTDNKVIVRYAGAGTAGQLIKAAKTSSFAKLCN